MKYSEFPDLCDREWHNGKGDILSLDLTDDSARELANEVLMRGEEMVLYLTQEDVADLRAGAGINKVVNPITRTAIKVNSGNWHDTVTIIHLV